MFMDMKTPYCPPGLIVAVHRPIGRLIEVSRVALLVHDGQKRGILGADLRLALASQPCLDACHLDAYLANPETIPHEWLRNAAGRIHFVHFWGTLYADEDGDLRVRCLALDMCTGSIRWRSTGLDAIWHELYPAAILL